MNDGPVSTLEQKKDRRGLLALIGAGGAAAVAALLGRGNGAKAHGTLHRDSSTTIPAVHGNNTNRGPGVEGTSYSLAGVWGESAIWHGVHGTNTSGGPYAAGVYGECSENIGVHGKSITGNGVRGRCSSGYGVYGWSNSSYGVRGHSDDNIGVYGDSNGRFGVYGSGGSGTGVKGEGRTGVTGKAVSGGGIGVYGNAGSGAVGILAYATGTKAALHVKGRSRFRQSGKATIAANTQAVNVPLGYNLAAGSLVVATLQGYAGAGIAIRYAKKVGANNIRITLTKNASQNVKVAYFIFTP